VTLPEFAQLAIQLCTHGKTYEEAIANAQEAIAGYLEYCEEEDFDELGVCKLVGIWESKQGSSSI